MRRTKGAEDHAAMAELYSLMADKAFQCISNRDAKKLALLLQEPWAAAEWVKFCRAFDTPDTVTRLNQVIDTDTDELMEYTLRQRKQRQRLFFGGASALTLLAAILIWHYLPANKPDTTVAQKGSTNKIWIEQKDGTRWYPAPGAAITQDKHEIYYDTASGMLSVLKQEQELKAHIPNGTDCRILLADSSLISLNAGSTISIPPSFKQHREVFISGEAFLQVSKNAAQPFMVHLPFSEITVLGTSFNVNSFDSSAIKVSLQEGTVKVASSGQQPVLLRMGLQTVFNALDHSMRIEEFRHSELSWLKGEYSIYNTSLNDLAKVLPRWIGIRVKITNRTAGAERFTGTIMREEPVDSLLKRLKSINITASYKDSTLYIQ